MSSLAYKVEQEEEQMIDVVIQAIKREFGNDCFLPMEKLDPVKRMTIDECSAANHEIKPHWMGAVCLDCDGWWRMECKNCGVQHYRCCC